MAVKILCFVILLLTFYGCDYEPTDTNIKTVTTPQNNINFTVLDTASINQLRGDVKITIQTQLNGHAIKSVLGYLDDKKISLSMSDSNHILFQTDYYPDGNYILTIILTTSTNSGSLADRVGAEEFYVKKQYPVTIFNAPIYTPKIKSFLILDGALSINWERYNQLCFKKYVVNKDGKPIATISNIGQTSFRDTSYIGEQTSYSLTTYVLKTSLKSDNVFCDGTAPTFVSTSKLPGDKMLITWNKYPFTSAFGKYVISFLDTSITITSSNDTTLIDNSPPLGSGTFYYLSVFSKTGVSAEKDCSIKGKPIGTPFDFGESDILKYIPDKNLIVKFWYSYANNTNSISYYDGNTLNLKQTRVMDKMYTGNEGRAISENGDYIYYCSNSNVYKINNQTLLLEGTTNLINLMPAGRYRGINPIYSIKISNNNIMAAIILDDQSLMTLAVFDMNSKKLITTFPFNFYDASSNFLISDDLKYIVFLKNVFKFDGRSLIKIGSISSYKSVFTKDYSSIIVVQNDNIQIIRSSDLQLQKQISGYYHFNPLCLDPQTGLFSVGFKIFDPSTGEERGYIKSTGINKFYLNGFYFADGYYEKIELN